MARLEFLCLHLHLPVDPARWAAPGLGKSMMSLSHVHHNDLHGAANAAQWPFAGARARLVAAFAIIHRGIIAAKLRRLRRELMYHGGDVNGQPSDQEAAQFPQPPLILGDKWDF
jgi:hypothetical protein